MSSTLDPPHPPTLAAPDSPRQPSSSTSKIPRRRPSTQLGEATRPGVTSGSRVVSSPVMLSSGRVGGEDGNRGGHSRKSSRSGVGLGVLSTELPAQPAAADTLQGRRRTSMSGASTPRLSNQPEMRRTPSLSIYIPATPSPSAASPSTSHQADPRRRPPPTFQSPISASDHPASSFSSPSAPPLAHQPRRCSRFNRPPRTPYPHHAQATGKSPQTPHMSEHSPHPHSHGPHARHLRSPSASSTLTVGTTYTYTSFDLQHPKTPREEREEREALARAERERSGLGLLRWLWRGRRGARREDEEEAVDERSALLRRDGGGEAMEQDGGRPKEMTKWEYVWSETVCYAKHMLPPILFFVVLVLVIALLASHQAVRRIVHPPKL
ncbi:hypothetical protein NBRC10512_003329 [Rhodotorula toruloides]|uniref:RHTO0S24e00166g1_1 n=2 Tax=Rhodotorula toruloides TaxID=5286 RepID=A0A061BGU0_RHOTO|nr:uncharacterized protein RHTO_04561 [Rhodotorula toruloides NP11]EMS19368.1 hypothetical protein RHTO_04561 [Rhodotorula toruloides NP11]CDR49182.1 RHTO0S24e00166g1_1 [Rhodotorula toruloides]